MRYVLVILFLFGCGKSEAQKRRELFDCKLIAEGTGRLPDCLQNRYNWSSQDAADAFIESLRDSTGEQ